MQGGGFGPEALAPRVLADEGATRIVLTESLYRSRML